MDNVCRAHPYGVYTVHSHGARLMKPAIVFAAVASCMPLAACTKADANDGSTRPYKVGVVDRGEVRVIVEETGVVSPERSIVVKSPISGVVQQLYVREGDHVQTGQALARVMPDIAQANSLAQLRSEIAKARIARDNPMPAAHERPAYRLPGRRIRDGPAVDAPGDRLSARARRAESQRLEFGPKRRID